MRIISKVAILVLIAFTYSCTSVPTVINEHTTEKELIDLKGSLVTITGTVVCHQGAKSEKCPPEIDFQDYSIGIKKLVSKTSEGKIVTLTGILNGYHHTKPVVPKKEISKIENGTNSVIPFGTDFVLPGTAANPQIIHYDYSGWYFWLEEIK